VNAGRASRTLRVTILGSGTSSGVPAIGCDCAVCRSGDPRDRRTRPSILIDLGEPDRVAEAEGAVGTGAADSPVARAVRFVLVDTSTDLRVQALANDVRRVDAVLFTHAHADHVFGIDEIRRFNALQRSAIPIMAAPHTLAEIRQTFAYIFNPPPAYGGGIPKLSPFAIGGPFTLGGVEIAPIPLLHGPMPILGFRVGAFAYLTDCNEIPAASWPLLSGVRALVLDALRDRPHSTHFSVDEALDVVARLRPERTYFTHIAHDLAHAATNARLPPGVELAYDGQMLEIHE
jgi:phosphoribosyl 1,2-cyclic phosphate phosphodiesterase